MRGRARLRAAVATLVVAGGIGIFGISAHADDVRPVTVDISERTPGLYLVQWRVPKVVPPHAMPGPVLPADCRAESRVVTEDLTVAWINRQSYECGESLAGREIGIAFPALNVALSTLLRVELLSGERYSHMLVPGESFWEVPDIDAGGFPRWARGAQRAVMGGAFHAVDAAHLALLVALVLLGATMSLRLAGVFATGQLAGIAIVTVSGSAASGGLGEVAVAVAAGLVAAQALLPTDERRQLAAVVGASGLVHGAALLNLLPPPDAYPYATAGWLLMGVLGMDAALLAGAMALGVCARRWDTDVSSLVQPAPGPVHTISAYGVAIAAFAIAMVPPPVESGGPVGGSGGLRLSGLPTPAAGIALGGSGRIAAQFPDAPVQAFVAIDAFEVRHETLVRVRDLADELDVPPGGVIEIEEQDALKQQVADYVATRHFLSIDGRSSTPATERVDFLGVDAQGALPRLAPVPEPVDNALVGVTHVFLLPTTPQQVMLDWSDFATTIAVPATVTDPEASVSILLRAEQPRHVWDNRLADDPIPVVTATAVEPGTLWLPLLSLAALAAALVVVVRGARLQRADRAPAARRTLSVVRVLLALALVVAPLGNVALAMPAAFGSTPGEGETRRILSGVLPNIYRAFEFRNEEAAFDRLALSVTGDALTDVYLEHQRALEMEERGGARARVESFEVNEVRSVVAEGSGFAAEASWTVGGTVVHFGHRHFRQNRYDARVVVVPDEGSWKIRSITVLDEERVR